MTFTWHFLIIFVKLARVRADAVSTTQVPALVEEAVNHALTSSDVFRRAVNFRDWVLEGVREQHAELAGRISTQEAYVHSSLRVVNGNFTYARTTAENARNRSQVCK